MSNTCQSSYFTPSFRFQIWIYQVNVDLLATICASYWISTYCFTCSFSLCQYRSSSPILSLRVLNKALYKITNHCKYQNRFSVGLLLVLVLLSWKEMLQDIFSQWSRCHFNLAVTLSVIGDRWLNLHLKNVTLFPFRYA